MLRTLLIAAALAAAATPALAERGRGRGGDDRGAVSGPVNVSQDQAIATARERGLTRLRETDLRRGRWKIEGWAADGRRIEVEVSASTGAVLKVEYYPA